VNSGAALRQTALRQTDRRRAACPKSVADEFPAGVVANQLQKG
jgi:hypothetical protein